MDTAAAAAAAAAFAAAPTAGSDETTLTTNVKSTGAVMYLRAYLPPYRVKRFK